MLRSISLTLVLVACSSSSASAPEAPSTSIPDAGPDPSAPGADGGVEAASPEPPARSSATLTGFTARSAVFRVARTGAGEGLLDVVLGDADDLCTTARTEKLTPALHLTLRAGGAMKPGSFPVVLDTVLGGSRDAPAATVVYWRVYDVADDTCAVTNTDQGATGGTIAITSFGEDTAVDGTIDVTLDQSGTKIEGSFHALPCLRPRPESLACFLAR